MTRTLCISGLKKIVANKLTKYWETAVNKKIIIVMKKIILISALLFVILSGYAQNQFADYVNYLKDNELIHTPDPKKIQRFEYRLFPRPLEVKKTHKKVIVIFDRKEWDAIQYMHRKMWMRKTEIHKQLDELKPIPNKFK